MNKEIAKKGLFILLIVGVFSIYGLRGSSISNTPQDKEWHWPDSIKNILIIPDSLLFRGDSINAPMDVYTPEQKEFARAMTTLMYKYTIVKDNHMIFDMSREEFFKTGIHEVYYDELIHSYKTMNDFIDKDTLNHSWNVAGDWEKVKEEMRLEMNLDVK